MAIGNWKTQVRKGLLDLCVMNLLSKREYYGYDLVQDLKTVEGLEMREGNVYPILARLQEDGLVESHTRPSSNGPPRKYFRVTARGRNELQAMNAHWNRMTKAVKGVKALNTGGRE